MSAAGTQRIQVRYQESQVWLVITEPSVVALRPTRMLVQLSPGIDSCKSNDCAETLTAQNNVHAVREINLLRFFIF